MTPKCRHILALRRGSSGVLRAPHWLRQRMARIRALPPPTIEDVQRYMAASANQLDSIQIDLEDKIQRGVPIR